MHNSMVSDRASIVSLLPGDPNEPMRFIVQQTPTLFGDIKQRQKETFKPINDQRGPQTTLKEIVFWTT